MNADSRKYKSLKQNKFNLQPFRSKKIDPKKPYKGIKELGAKIN